MISVADHHVKGSSLALLIMRAHDGPMILSDCPTCGRRELRGMRSVHAHHSNRGDALAITCTGCGSVLRAGTNRVLRASALEIVA